MAADRLGIPQVVVLIPLTLKGHRDVFEGILRYARANGPWRLYRLEGRPGEQRLLDLRRWGCTGIITASCTLREAQAIVAADVPVVVMEPDPDMLAGEHPLSSCASLRFDSYATGELAGQFFLERGYQHCAYVGEAHDLYWSQARGQGFRDTIEKGGGTCDVYRQPTVSERRDWAIEQPRMAAWLTALPKPVGLFAAMDGRARQVLDACLDAGIAVPEEMAVLGVDDDPFICEATFPALSSIQTSGEHCGYLLASHLDALMRKKRIRKRIYWVRPTRVIRRRSTDATDIEDKLVARAREYIWREAGHKPIHVPDIVELFGSSRRYAETRFKSAVGRTIMEEIRRVKLERVSALLRETNIPIGEIARQCDFARESHLAFIFRKHFNMTMSEYRAAASRKNYA